MSLADPSQIGERFADLAVLSAPPATPGVPEPSSAARLALGLGALAVPLAQKRPTRT